MSTKEEWMGDLGRRWARMADRQDALLSVFESLGADALGPVAGRRVLDLGCGPGASALDLAARGAEVTGVDVSPDLLATARSRLASAGALAGAVSLRELDAASDDLGGPFDALFSRFGAMFFDDPVPAWANIRAAMAPGAPLVVVAWRSIKENDWAGLPLRLCAGLLPEVAKTPAGAPGPFGWADPGFFSAALTGAGWHDVACAPHERAMTISAGDAADPVERAIEALFTAGPLSSRLSALDDATREQARTRLRDGLAPHVSDGAVRLGGATWLVTARA